MPVNILNPPGLMVLDFKETDTEYHVKAEPAAISKRCPHCARSHSTIGHGKLPLFVQDLPIRGKSMMIRWQATDDEAQERFRRSLKASLPPKVNLALGRYLAWEKTSEQTYPHYWH
ncbi:MAG: hypothetical protein CVU16_06275 [Betaproteobacteria bacterium HGW-Betaproteobacteria-10]|nr:MAG: hypothetical protein CVU16_06275 [Betaproteobacteria bacterium HGW-Betaproteobacteria-10]